MSWTRRQVLAEGAKLALVAAPVGLGLGCQASDSCVDPDRLNTGQRSLRASLHFSARSPSGSEKDCAGCQFFSASSGDAQGCGVCQILQGQVNSRGYCDSWSPRAGSA